MPKQLLLLRADRVAVTDDDVVAFEKVCMTFGVFVTVKNIESKDDLENALAGRFNYICFAGHGDENSYGDNKTLSISWTGISDVICR